MAESPPLPLVPQGERERLIAKATNWLEVGGFFNPEMMANGDAQNLVIELRNALAAMPRSVSPVAED